MFVLGVDPGLSRCGYCCLDVRGRESRAVALGVLRTPATDAVPVRLAALQADVRELLAEWRPAVVALERVLFQVNVRTAMGVGQASGIVMAESVAAGADVVEYSPNQVKEAVAGWGAAPKEQIQQMVQTLLRLPVRPEPPDAADAAAVALCHVAMAPGASRRPAGRPHPAEPRSPDPLAAAIARATRGAGTGPSRGLGSTPAGPADPGRGRGGPEPTSRRYP